MRSSTTAAASSIRRRSRGQVIGSVVHTLGNTLFEWMGYDEQAQPITTTFADYLLPTAPEIPHIE